MRKIRSVEDLVYRTKEAELCATVWAWNTDYASEKEALDNFTSGINKLIDRFVIAGIGRFGIKEEGISVNSIKYTSFDLNFFRNLLEDIEEFYEVKRVKDVLELAAILVEMIELITVTLYKLNLN
jgi:hypothetical protein